MQSAAAAPPPHYVVMAKQAVEPNAAAQGARERTRARRSLIETHTALLRQRGVAPDMREEALCAAPVSSAAERKRSSSSSSAVARKKRQRTLKTRVFVSTDPFRDTDRLNSTEPDGNYVLGVVCGPFAHEWMAGRLKSQWCRANRGVAARAAQAYELAVECAHGFYIDPQSVYCGNAGADAPANPRSTTYPSDEDDDDDDADDDEDLDGDDDDGDAAASSSAARVRSL